MKKIFGLSIIVMLCCIMLAVGVNAERGVVDSGTCGAEGDNLTWTLYDDGELVISGSGRMQEWYYNEYNHSGDFSPWVYKGLVNSITKVTVEDGVESIGSYAFLYFVNLTDFDIADSVEIIGDGAFYSCIALTDVEISAQNIGSNAFSNCTSLEEVHLSKSVKYIGYDVFKGCTSLTNIYAEHDDTSNITLYDIDGVLFKKEYSKFQLEGEWYESTGYTLLVYPFGRTDETYSIPEETTAIYGYAFAHQTNLKSVVIPESVYNIGDGAFSQCTNLADVDMKGAGAIGMAAFVSCTSLEKIELPEGTNSLRQLAFAAAGIKEITIPKSVTFMEPDIFSECKNLEKIYCYMWTTAHNYAISNNLPYKLLDEPEGTVVYGTCGAQGNNLTWILYDDGELVISGGGAMQNYNGVPSPWHMMGVADSIKKVTVEAGVETIGNDAFRQCVNLAEVDIADRVGIIGDGAFYSCIALTDVEISAQNIGSNAFFGCTALEEVHLSKDVTYISESAFNSCTGLKNIYAECDDSKDTTFYDIDGVLFQKVYTSYEYEGEINESTNDILVKYPMGRTDEEYVIPEGTKNIANQAFIGCANIKAVDIPESVILIGEFAFSTCINLTDVDMKGVETICMGAFVNCASLETVDLPDSTYQLGQYVFANSAIKEITIPKSVTSMDAYIFELCPNLEKIYCYMGSVAHNYAMSFNLPFEVLDEPEGTVASGTCGEQGDNLTWILYDDGELVISGSGAMQNYEFNYDYQSVSSPWYMMGIADFIKKVTVEAGVETIGNNAFIQCVNLTEIDIADSVEIIGNGAFYSCIALTDVEISAQSIGSNAFSNCTSLEEVNLSKSVKYIDYSVFEGCTSLTNIYAERDDTSNITLYDIDGVLFRKEYSEFQLEGEWYESTGYTLLVYPFGRTDETYSIPEETTAIYGYAFVRQTNLKSVVIPESVYSIGEWAFSLCTNLTDVDMKGAGTIHIGAFADCRSLETVEIPKGTLVLHEYVFAGSAIKKITIPESVIYIAPEAFLQCLNSITIYGYAGSYAHNFAMSQGMAFEELTPQIIASGEHGDNLFWTLDNVGELIISGQGDMDYDFDHDQYPWEAYAKRIRKVTIKDGVTSIASDAFNGCFNLVNVVIPDGVTDIGACAFGNCSSLESITLPASLEYVGQAVLIGCDSLTDIYVDNDNEEFCDIDGVLFSKDKTALYTYPIGRRDSTYQIPESVTYISCNAFDGAKHLTSMTIPGNVKYVEMWAFSGCSSLANLVIENGVEEIASYAFEGTSVSIVTIPASVSYIDWGAFRYSFYMTDIVVDSDNEYYCSVDGVLFNKDKTMIHTYPDGKTDENYVIPDSVTSIEMHCFEHVGALTSLTIPHGIEKIDNSMIVNCYNLATIYGYAGSGAHVFAREYGIPFEALPSTGITVASGKCGEGLNWTLDDSLTLTISGNGAMDNWDPEYGAIPEWKTVCPLIKKVVIENGVTSIGDGAFSDFVSMTDITIPDSIKHIGNYAFACCASLTEIDIDIEGITYIGTHTFANCTSLESVTIPYGIDAVSQEMFINCTSLTHVNLPNSITSIADGAFALCSKLESVYIERQVIYLGVGVFFGCDNLTIHGYAGTAAETYANENGIPFEAIPPIDVPPVEDLLPSDATEVEITTVTNSIGEISGNQAIIGHNPADNHDDVEFIKVSLTNIEVQSGEEGELSKLTFTVTPEDENGNKVSKPNKPITFLLPVPSSISGTHVEVYHDSIPMGVYEIQGADSDRYIEVTSFTFSEFAIVATDATEATVYAAVIGDVGHESLAEALKAAKKGETVTLVVDCEAADIMLKGGIILDLNGHTLTAEYMVAFNGNSIVDNSDVKSGLLVVAKDNLVLAATNTQMPVYSAEEGGYRFATMKMTQYKIDSYGEDFVKIKFRPAFGTESVTNTMFSGLLADGGSSCDVEILIRVTWPKSDGTIGNASFVYNDDFVKETYVNGKTFTITITGLNAEAYGGLEAVFVVRSLSTNVEMASPIMYTYNP